MIEVLAGIHVVPYSPHLGEGWESMFSNINVAKADVFDDLGLEPGDFFGYEGRIFQTIRARAAIAKGNILKRFWGGATRTGTVEAAPAPTKAVFKGSFALVEGDMSTTHTRHPVLIFISAGTGIGQLRRVKDTAGDTANLIHVAKLSEALSVSPTLGAADSPDAWTTLPVAGDAFDVIVPWEVTNSAAAADFIHGVGLGTITDGNYGIIGIAGAFLAKLVGSTDAVTVGGAVVPSATASTGKGPTAAGLTATEAARTFGYAYSAHTGASALRLVEFFGNFR